MHCTLANLKCTLQILGPCTMIYMAKHLQTSAASGAYKATLPSPLVHSPYRVWKAHGLRIFMALESGSRVGMNRKAELSCAGSASALRCLSWPPRWSPEVRTNRQVTKRQWWTPAGVYPPFLSFSLHSVVSGGSRIIGSLCVWWIHGVFTLGSMFSSFYVYSGSTAINGWCSSRKTIYGVFFDSLVCRLYRLAAYAASKQIGVCCLCRIGCIFWTLWLF